ASLASHPWWRCFRSSQGTGRRLLPSHLRSRGVTLPSARSPPGTSTFIGLCPLHGAARRFVATGSDPGARRAHRLPPHRDRGARSLPQTPAEGGCSMKKGGMRGFGRVYKRPDSDIWWIRYSWEGREYRESSKSTRYDDAATLLQQRNKERTEGT